MKKSEEIHLYVDGSSKFNNQSSSATCACLFLKYYGSTLMNWNLVADFTFGTSNRAELAAAVLAIKSILKTRERVIIFSDSKYVIRGATDWINKWRKENWKSHKGQTIANVELWIQLSELLFQRAVTWQHVRAHRNCLGNNIADKACKLCWKTNDRIELSGINKSEHTIHDLVERRLHDIQRRLRRG